MEALKLPLPWSDRAHEAGYVTQRLWRATSCTIHLPWQKGITDGKPVCHVPNAGRKSRQQTDTTRKDAPGTGCGAQAHEHAEQVHAAPTAGKGHSSGSSAGSSSVAQPSSTNPHAISCNAWLAAQMTQQPWPPAPSQTPAEVLMENVSSLSRQVVWEASATEIRGRPYRPQHGSSRTGVITEFASWLAQRSTTRGGITSQDWIERVLYESCWLRHARCPALLDSAVSHFKKLIARVPMTTSSK